MKRLRKKPNNSSSRRLMEILSESEKVRQRALRVLDETQERSDRAWRVVNETSNALDRARTQYIAAATIDFTHWKQRIAADKARSEAEAREREEKEKHEAEKAQQRQQETEQMEQELLSPTPLVRVGRSGSLGSFSGGKLIRTNSLSAADANRRSMLESSLMRTVLSPNAGLSPSPAPLNLGSSLVIVPQSSAQSLSTSSPVLTNPVKLPERSSLSLSSSNIRQTSKRWPVTSQSPSVPTVFQSQQPMAKEKQPAKQSQSAEQNPQHQPETIAEKVRKQSDAARGPIFPLSVTETTRSATTEVESDEEVEAIEEERGESENEALAESLPEEFPVRKPHTVGSTDDPLARNSRESQTQYSNSSSHRNHKHHHHHHHGTHHQRTDSAPPIPSIGAMKHHRRTDSEQPIQRNSSSIQSQTQTQPNHPTSKPLPQPPQNQQQKPQQSQQQQPYSAQESTPQQTRATESQEQEQEPIPTSPQRHPALINELQRKLESLKGLQRLERDIEDKLQRSNWQIPFADPRSVVGTRKSPRMPTVSSSTKTTTETLVPMSPVDMIPVPPASDESDDDPLGIGNKKAPKSPSSSPPPPPPPTQQTSTSPETPKSTKSPTPRTDERSEMAESDLASESETLQTTSVFEVMKAETTKASSTIDELEDEILDDESDDGTSISMRGGDNAET